MEELSDFYNNDLGYLALSSGIGSGVGSYVSERVYSNIFEYLTGCKLTKETRKLVKERKEYIEERLKENGE